MLSFYYITDNTDYHSLWLRHHREGKIYWDFIPLWPSPTELLFTDFWQGTVTLKIYSGSTSTIIDSSVEFSSPEGPVVLHCNWTNVDNCGDFFSYTMSLPPNKFMFSRFISPDVVIYNVFTEIGERFSRPRVYDWYLNKKNKSALQFRYGLHFYLRNTLS